MKSFSTATLLAFILLMSLSVMSVAQNTSSYKVSPEQVRNLLHRLDEHAESYRSLVDILLEVSRLDGTPREERLDFLVEQFEREVDALEARFNQNASTVEDVERVLRAAERVDAPLTRALSDQSLSRDPSLRERAQTEWALLKSTLTNLADFYDIEWESGDPTPARAVQPVTSDRRIYTVRAGDTLFGIANRFGTTLAAIRAANPGIKNANRITVGQRLTIP